MKNILNKLTDKMFWKRIFSRETAKKLLVWQKPQKIAAAVAGGIILLVAAWILGSYFAAGNTVDAIRACDYTEAASQYEGMNGLVRWLSTGRIENELDETLPQTEFAQVTQQMDALNKLADSCCLDDESDARLILNYFNALKGGDFAAAQTLLGQIDEDAAALQRKSGADGLTEYVMARSYISREENELVSSAAMQNYADCEAFFKLLGDKCFDAQVLPQIRQMLRLANYERYNPVYALYKACRDTVDEADERLQSAISCLNASDKKSAKAYFNSAVTLLQEAEANCEGADRSKAWVDEYVTAVEKLSSTVQTLKEQAMTDGYCRMLDYEGAQKVYQNICSKIIGVITEVAGMLPTQQP